MEKLVNQRPKEVNEAIEAYIKSHYHYDTSSGCVRRADGSRVKGCVKNNGYIKTSFQAKGKYTYLLMHHIVWFLCTGHLPKQLDHINGDRGDNRYENLREATGTENNLNSVHPWKPNKKTGLPGVCLKSDGRYETSLGNKHFRSRDKYQLFHDITLLGRQYQST